VEDEDAHAAQAIRRPRTFPPADRGYVSAAMANPEQTYRLRAPASGRERLAAVQPGGVYVDRETGEEMEPVTRALPLAPAASALVRTPENLRACSRCDQLIGLDVSDCPYCGLRQGPVEPSPEPEASGGAS
jgi:hypothetical protein